MALNYSIHRIFLFIEMLILILGWGCCFKHPIHPKTCIWKIRQDLTIIKIDSNSVQGKPNFFSLFLPVRRLPSARGWWPSTKFTSSFFCHGVAPEVKVIQYRLGTIFQTLSCSAVINTPSRSALPGTRSISLGSAGLWLAYEVTLWLKIGILTMGRIRLPRHRGN